MHVGGAVSFSGTSGHPEAHPGGLQANVKTLSVRLGVKRVFWACIILLELAYAGAVGIGALSQV